MKIKIALIVILLLLIPLGTVSNAEIGIKQQERGPAKLYFSDAALDDEGNLYVIVNTWTTTEKDLVRILPDHSIDRKFRLARLDDCCTVNPFAVDVDADGNIYIITYQDWVNDFMIAKYDSFGELVEDYGAGGTIEHYFDTPVDLAVSPDGTAYVVDMGYPDIYRISPDGGEVRGFVLENYDLQEPSKIQLGPDGAIYLFDQFDPAFSRYEIGQGIVALNYDGTPVDYFGQSYGDINSGEDPLYFASFVMDHDGTIWVLGSISDSGPLSGAYHYNADGTKIGEVYLEYRLGDVDTAAGVIADKEPGFIIFEINALSLVVMRYAPDGKLREKYSAEVFKRPF